MSVPIRLDGVQNIRDLGGILTADGRRVRPGRVFRSGSLHEATPADRTALRGLGVRVVADLRSGWERRLEPYELDFARVVHAPMGSDARVRSIRDRFLTGEMTSAELEDWWDLTGIFDAPEEHVEGVRAVFGALLSLSGGEAILYHCHGGKDRTGLITTLFLEGLGVPREAVAADLLRSDFAHRHRHAAESDRFSRALAAMDLTPAALKAITSVDRAWFDRLTAGIEERHGSVAGYLADYVGIGREGIERLRALYLEPAGPEEG